MNRKRGTVVLCCAAVLAYGGFYLFNSISPPDIQTIQDKYLPTESLADLESEAELIVKATKVAEENKVFVATSSSDPTIKYEDPITFSSFKIEDVYFDKTNTFKKEEQLIVEEFAGYVQNRWTGSKTLVIPEEYTLAKQGNSYILFLRKSKSSPQNYILFANHFGKYAIDSGERNRIINKLKGNESSAYQEIENEIDKKYKVE